MKNTIRMFFPALCLIGFCAIARAQNAADLVIARDGKTTASIVVSQDAGTWEKRAAVDLAKYIEMMSGAKPNITSAAAGDGPFLVIGRAALKSEPSLGVMLAKVAKKNPTVRADAIALRRVGNRVYLAGSNDESHYFAVSQLLQNWGCRWYLPTEFGECVPEQKLLTIGALEYSYAPPFEIRHYWLSWNGDATGADEFRRRNFMTETSIAGMGHALGQYTTKLVPPGKTMFNVPLSEDATAQEVAARIEADYARGVPDISLAIEDGNYLSDSPRDAQLQAGIYDKYALQPSNSDAVITLYNNVARILHLKYPNSKTRIGGLAYANVSLPPQQVATIEPNIVMWLAPIDIDPNHGMDDANSPPRQELGAMMARWAQLLNGRLAIYDYDQGQLVWRDLPAPSHRAFSQDVKHYRDAKILGIGTESRGAMATVFLNLFFRGQLMWNPDADTNALLAEFYPKFYGPAAAPMADYWNAIFAAWDKTIVTEHEYFLAPAIYTPALVAQLRGHLEAAEAIIKTGEATSGVSPRLWNQYQTRLKFTRLSFDVLDNYTAMTRAAATEADYQSAIMAGERGLAAREALTKMNATFTTTGLESGDAWWPGEVAQMRGLQALTDGTKGTLIVKTPLEWAFHRDPHDSGLARGWAYQEADLSFWKASGKNSLAGRRDYPATQWEMLRTDLYLQAQGVLDSDGQSYSGHFWYQSALDLLAAQTTGKVHLLFPGLFNDGWLYLNGVLIAHRAYAEPWWKNDYKFQWDVDLTGKLKAGRNLLTLRGFNPHHMGGIFRRPILYRPAA